MTKTSGVTGIVLAGGRSTRFGGPKLAVEIEGRPLLDHAIAAVAEVADAVFVAGARVPDALATTARGAAVRSVPDAEPFGGPLAAMSGALHAATTEHALVVGGDMPALVPVVLRAMLEWLAADANADAVVLAGPADASRLQVLPLAIDVASVSAAALEALAAGDRSLVRLLDRLRVVEIPEAEWRALDPTGRTLFDVDRPSDVARIRHELR